MQRTTSNASSGGSSGRYSGNRLFTLQPCRYRTSKEKWKHLSAREKTDEEELPTSFRLLTWNVNFDALYPQARLTTALEYIQKKVFGCDDDDDEPDPCCILLQEVHTRAFDAILNNAWVRAHFVITPANPLRFPFKTCFGNVTLVTRSLSVSESAMLEFTIVSDQERSALVTDIRVGIPNSDRAAKLRVFNTHLESLSDGAQRRRQQMALIRKLSQEGEKMHGTIIAGDMNAISPADSQMVSQVGLRDAYQGAELDEAGNTWGYQGGNAGRYPAGRLDKILYVPSKGMMVESPERIGIGLRTEKEWTSDHYGLITTVHIMRPA